MTDDNKREIDPNAGSDGASVGLENVDTCARCDAPIDRREWHYTGLERGEDEIRVYVFCSENCRDRWRDGE